MTLDGADLMRALAHPTRLALVEVLQLHENLTATEASELLGITPTNCAFHLRAMGRYGLVEEVGKGPGRRRPWRLAVRSLGFSDVQPDAESTAAARALSDVIVDQWLNRIRRVQADRDDEPDEWREVFGGSHSIAFGTADEVAEMIVDIRAILGRYDDRLRQRRSRPADSRAVELLLFAQPYESELPSSDQPPASGRSHGSGQPPASGVKPAKRGRARPAS
jgi:DNA-binding transcriptional ArsR family regulator